jgi:hypothetical protein
LFELSAQVTWIAVAETAVAVGLLGAAGMAGVVDANAAGATSEARRAAARPTLAALVEMVRFMTFLLANARGRYGAISPFSEESGGAVTKRTGVARAGLQFPASYLRMVSG